MLKARWTGYEIDSSEAAYEVKVPQPEELGTLVRRLLGSGYFVRSYYLFFESPFPRLRDFIVERGHQEDKLGAKALQYLEKQIAKFNDRRWTTIGVRAIEAILNYVGTHRHELLEAGTFHFKPTSDQQEMYGDYDYEFESGQKIDETVFYSEQEIPLDGVVLLLGCALVGLDKLPPDEQAEVYELVQDNYKRVGLLDDMRSWFGPGRDFVRESLTRRHDISLRVRLNPDATFTITGRWFDDGQFIYPYYEYLLQQAAEKAGIKIGFHMIY